MISTRDEAIAALAMYRCGNTGHTTPEAPDKMLPCMECKLWAHEWYADKLAALQAALEGSFTSDDVLDDYTVISQCQNSLHALIARLTEAR